MPNMDSLGLLGVHGIHDAGSEGLCRLSAPRVGRVDDSVWLRLGFWFSSLSVLFIYRGIHHAAAFCPTTAVDIHPAVIFEDI